MTADQNFNLISDLSIRKYGFRSTVRMLSYSHIVLDKDVSPLEEQNRLSYFTFYITADFPILPK